MAFLDILLISILHFQFSSSHFILNKTLLRPGYGCLFNYYNILDDSHSTFEQVIAIPHIQVPSTFDTTFPCPDSAWVNANLYENVTITSALITPHKNISFSSLLLQDNKLDNLCKTYAKTFKNYMIKRKILTDKILHQADILDKMNIWDISNLDKQVDNSKHKRSAPFGFINQISHDLTGSVLRSEFDSVQNIVMSLKDFANVSSDQMYHIKTKLQAYIQTNTATIDNIYQALDLNRKSTQSIFAHMYILDQNIKSQRHMTSRHLLLLNRYLFFLQP